MYIGISKFIEIGPISFLHSVAVGFFSVIFAIRVCSKPPWNFLIYHSAICSFDLYSARCPWMPLGISNATPDVTRGTANLTVTPVAK